MAGFARTAGTGGDNDFALARFNADGSLDTSFDGDGRVLTDVAPSGGRNDIGRDVLVQPDGRIVVVGSLDPGIYADAAVLRYNADGSLDTSFSGDGKLTTRFNSSTGEANAVALLPDGKLLVAGTSSFNASNFNFGLARFNADGTVDTGFGFNGAVSADFGSNSEAAFDLAVQADGKIVLVGKSANNLALARFNADGSLDTSFDGDGLLVTDIVPGTESGQSVLVQPDGRIVVAGVSSSSGSNDFALARYNADGSLDTSFDGDGLLVTDFDAGDDQAYSVLLQADGRIVVAGYAMIGGDRNFALARYNPDGSPDLAFGTQVNTLDASPTYNQDAPAVVLDADYCAVKQRAGRNRDDQRDTARG